MKIQQGKDLYTLITEALEETGFSFLVKRENNKDILKTKGAIYVNAEGNVVEYEDKPIDKVGQYNAFWCAFGFRKVEAVQAVATSSIDTMAKDILSPQILKERSERDGRIEQRLDSIERELDNFHKMHNGSHPPIKDRD